MLNKVMLIGNLGADPEVHVFENGVIANLSVATTVTWKDKVTGEKREATEWHRVSLFNRTAEIAQQYLKKGSKVYIEGSLHTRKWKDQNGNDRYTTEIRGNTMTMLGDANTASTANNTAMTQPKPNVIDEIPEEEIPFS